MTRPVKKSSFLKPSLYTLAVAVFLGFAALTLAALSRPPAVTTETTLNNVEQGFDVSYKVEVIPCTLYPEGGVIEPEGAIMSDIVKTLLFDVNAYIAADYAVKLSGDVGLEAVLIAQDHWQKAFPLVSTRHVEGTKERYELINGSYRLNLAELVSFINKVAEETHVQPNYFLRIQPVFSGTIEGEGLNAALTEVPTMLFELNGNELVRADKAEDGESVLPPSSSFRLDTPVVSSVTTEEVIRLIGLEIPVTLARVLFGVPTLLMLLFGAAFLARMLKRKSGLVTEAEKIERTYGKRIFRLGAQSGVAAARSLALNTFGDLLRLANERELPIFKASGGNGEACFLVIDSGVLYSFTVPEGVDQAQTPLAAGFEK